jgi:hypothetical protein
VRRHIVITAVVFVCVAAACGSSTKSSGSSNGESGATAEKSFFISTPDGQVSVSRSGQLSPNWPSAFPLPPGSTVAGSGSLGNSSSTRMVAVYSSTQTPEQIFDFYNSSSGLTISSPSSLGAGSFFAGELSFSGAYKGTMGVVGKGDTSYFAIVIESSGTGSTTTSLEPSPSGTSS